MQNFDQAPVPADIQDQITALSNNIASKEFNPSANASLISWIVANVPDRSCLPFSFQKIGNNQLSDVPFATATTEFAGIVTGNGDRLVVELNRFSSSGYQKFTRTVFQNNWYGDWEEWALKSDLNDITSNSEVKSQLTPATGITINSVLKQEIGKLVTVYMYITTSSAINALTEIFSGLPTPTSTQNYVSTFLAHDAASNADTYRMSVRDGGKVQNLDALPNGKVIRATFSYFKN